MPAKVKTITEYIEELAPSSIALPGDPVGLQLGHPEAEISKVLVALDPDGSAVKEADSKKAEMLVTHHPLFYNKLSSIDESLPKGALISSAIRNNLNIFSAHTNFDIAPRGVSYQLARALDLPADEAEVLEVTGSDEFLKLVVFVPAGHEDDIRDALDRAGAGKIGDYSHCTFQTPGTGTFMPGEGTDPYIGSHGRLEKADELRLETIMPVSRRLAVIEALEEAHPYEEVAYDLYPLALEGRPIGMGLVMSLDKPLALKDILQTCRERLNPDSLRYRPSAKNKFIRIAVCGGSGGSLVEKAAQRGAGLLISGDFRYHDLKLAEDYGLALVDAGHSGTEWPGMAYLCRHLAERLKSDGWPTEVSLQTPTSSVWRLF